MVKATRRMDKNTQNCELLKKDLDLANEHFGQK